MRVMVVRQLLWFSQLAVRLVGRYGRKLQGHLSITVAAGTDHDDPVVSAGARAAEVLFGGVGGDGEQSAGDGERQDRLECGNSVARQGGDAFGDFVLLHTVMLQHRVCDLLAVVIGHLDNQANRVGDTRLEHALGDVRTVVLKQPMPKLAGLVRNAGVHMSPVIQGGVLCSLGSTR